MSHSYTDGNSATVWFMTSRGRRRYRSPSMKENTWTGVYIMKRKSFQVGWVKLLRFGISPSVVESCYCKLFLRISLKHENDTRSDKLNSIVACCLGRGPSIDYSEDIIKCCCWMSITGVLWVEKKPHRAHQWLLHCHVDQHELAHWLASSPVLASHGCVLLSNLSILFSSLSDPSLTRQLKRNVINIHTWTSMCLGRLTLANLTKGQIWKYRHMETHKHWRPAIFSSATGQCYEFHS